MLTCKETCLHNFKKFKLLVELKSKVLSVIYHCSLVRRPQETNWISIMSICPHFSHRRVCW